jgi:murein DD-endopeptidase MepM/ murein hydrolase activator NlpD
VTAGQQIAAVGNSGASSGPHLHFEIWPDGWYSSKQSKPIDPLPDLLAWAGAS